MSKKGGGAQTTTTSTGPDAMAQDWMRRTQAAAESAGTGAPTNAARNFYAGMIPGANLGMGALSGDPNSVNALMNPYTSGVIDRVKANFGDLNALTSQGINDAATKAGAFGGSRHGVAEGVALGQNAKTAQDQIAQLTQGGYNDAMTRAGQLVNFGFGGAQAMPGLDPSTMRFQATQQAGQGMPWGQSTTTTQPMNRNAGAGALGGALGGAQIGSYFGPWGAAAGGGIGGLLGLFS